ncbi:hypothetical protein FA048_05310 [Pedobacter polaris]|uniref:Peptidase E n=1 Tax=Pedobacter polaris TaxID=2571273 RepID=A0A4U1CUU7_9SPHI|nr:DUF6702 family protein [Pedobacter polaris]TKC13037.1 hypothetical protein FA048_05310 [Pedobacter polaris]
MQAIYSKLLLVSLIFTCFLPATSVKESKHPLHVSTTEINFNSKEKSLEISCRIFTDDFENVLTKSYNVKTDLNKPSMQKAMDELIKKYLTAHLQYNVNGKTVNATYVGFEKDQEATNVYLEIGNITSLQKLSINNTILYDLFDDQMNILHVEKGGIRKSVRANYPSNALVVNF